MTFENKHFIHILHYTIMFIILLFFLLHFFHIVHEALWMALLKCFTQLKKSTLELNKMMKYCDPRHKHTELKASINHYGAANHWPAADTHLKPITCSKPTRLIRYTTNLIYYTHLNSLVMWNIGLFHLFDLKIKLNQVSSSDGGAANNRKKNCRVFQVVMNPQGIPALVSVPPRWLRCSIMATVWCMKPRAHRKSFTLLSVCIVLHERWARCTGSWGKLTLRPLSHQTFIFPSVDKWPLSWWINADVRQPHTHTEQPSPSRHARSPSTNPEPLLVTANNYSSHRYAELFDPAIILINDKQGGVMELRRLQREHGRQTGWKLCSPLGRTTSEIPLTTGQYHEGLQRTEGSPFTDFLHLWVFAALSHLKASQTI